MHPECEQYVRNALAHIYDEQPPITDELDVLDVGGSDINGTLHHLFPQSRRWVVDPNDPLADFRAPAEHWVPPRSWDLVLCTEVLEHTAEWRGVLATCVLACREGGALIVTAAAPPRAPHGARSASGAMDEGEWYANITPEDLAYELERLGQDGAIGYDARHGDVGATVGKVHHP